jgi:hypothetical protein
MIDLDLMLNSLFKKNDYVSISNEELIGNAIKKCMSNFSLEDRYIDDTNTRQAKYIKGMDDALQGVFINHNTGEIKSVYCFSKIFDIFKNLSLEQFPDITFAHKNAIILTNEFFNRYNYHRFFRDNPIIMKNFTDFQLCSIIKTVSLNEEIDGNGYCFRYISVENTLNPLKFSEGASNGQLILVYCSTEQHVFNRKISANKAIFFIWIDGYWLPYTDIWGYPSYSDVFNLT